MNLRQLSQAGFSSLELIVSVSVMVIVTSVVALEFTDFRDAHNRGETMTQIEFDLRRARSEATSRGTRIVFAAAEDGQSYTVGIDELPYSEDWNPQPEVVLFSKPMPEDMSISYAGSIIFNSRGQMVDPWGWPSWGYIMFDQASSSSGYLNVYPSGAVEGEFYSY